MRALHIANWYPNALNAHEAPFIRRHVEALRTQGTHEVWHIQVQSAGRWALIGHGPHADRTLLLLTPVRAHYLLEWLTALLVFWAWCTRRRHRFSVVNFYIAYPVGVRIAWLKRLIRRPMTFTEQWSAYHFSFGSGSPGLDRTRRMFRHGLPVICVSEALASDIRDFSRVPGLQTRVIDNVVDAGDFRPALDGDIREGVFFAVSLWQRPKRPEVMIDALALLVAQGRKAHLRLAGDGDLLDALRTRIDQLRLGAHVTLLGRLASADVAAEMKRAHALWHCSDYETFSVVCAEALCCGTPVVASRVGGIPGFVNGHNGVLVEANDAATWAAAISANWDRLLGIDRPALSRHIIDRFSAQTVGRDFQHILAEVAGGQTSPSPIHPSTMRPAS